MKRIFTLFTRLFLFIFFPGLLFAQEKNDYTILLNSGKFIPEANSRNLSKNSTPFKKSLFDGKYYITLQFNSLPDPGIKARMATEGIELVDYIPNYAYTAVVRATFDLNSIPSFNIRSVFQFSPEQKTVPALLKGNFPAHAVKALGYVDVNVITYEKLGTDKINRSLLSLGASLLEDAPMFRRVTLRVPQVNAKKLVALSFVQWVEFIDPPNQVENTLGRTLHRVSVLNDGVRNLKGDGINVGIWDEGEISPHLDFSPAGRLNQVEFNSASQHSTHCAGTILGRGLINATAKGMAANAKLYSYNFSGNIQTEMAAGIPGNNLIVSSHSYGSTQTCGLNGAGVIYSNTSRETDINLNNFPFHLHCHSAGNSQVACSGGWSTITASGKSAKNNILVANITSLEALSGSSSCGPVQDGRVKPEISAFGTSVFSTSTPVNSYATLSGTSMSTPGVAGSVALLVQRYKQLNGEALPPSTLIKNTILNTAQDLGNPGPDYRFGYGRLNALQAVRILEENRYALNNVTTGATNDVTINLPAGAARLRIMLTWNDPAGTANANPALVNNLNLSVIQGAATTLPWILDPNTPANSATRGTDNVSNIEQVTIDNPASGEYTLRVNGFAVPTGPNQAYALTWSVDMPYIEIIYPNGNESFNPGTSETITWDNAGVSGNQTVEYSLDNGGSWITISNSVPAATTRLSWSIPVANTATAQVRVTNGALTDISDQNFKILGTPTGFSISGGAGCSSGEISFTWTAVADATNYDIYALNGSTGEFAVQASNLPGTSHTITGLTPGASMWFYIVAKNNSSNAVSMRSNAINGTVSNGGGGLGIIGTVSGQSTICGTPSGVGYSIPLVSGATVYSWTAPPGAVVASGQGTDNITINYLAGSNNGNVSVFASNGTCNTPTSTLAVTIGSTSIAAPVTGGNQSQTICPGAVIPTLTANATVPANHTVIWYTTATGGSVVTNPILNTTGTVTYHAASKNNTTGCEGTARTAVVLTITQVAAATAVAGGSVSFCQGGTVVLTASAGSSYVWKKAGVVIVGATSQTFTANSSGSYTAEVTTGTCVSSSNPIVVTVNANPVASISANDAVIFCQGGNVVLTASAGSSWLWSNGAITQSITVAATGNYSVTIINSSGCSSASAATSVTVSPKPTVSISAAPYTNLFPGLTTTLTANVTPPGTYNFTWYKNGILVPGATTATLTGIDLDDLGSYTVMTTNTTGLLCSNTSAALVIGDSATSKLFIYPSPNGGQFKVRYYTTGANAQNTLVIFDSKGGRIYSGNYLIGSPYQIMDVDIRQHGRGIYRVVLFSRAGKKIADGSVVVQ